MTADEHIEREPAGNHRKASWPVTARYNFRPGPVGSTQSRASLFHAFSNFWLFFQLFALFHLGIHDLAHRVSLAKFEERMRLVACSCDMQRGVVVLSRRRAVCLLPPASSIAQLQLKPQWRDSNHRQPRSQVRSIAQMEREAWSCVLRGLLPLLNRYLVVKKGHLGHLGPFSNQFRARMGVSRKSPTGLPGYFYETEPRAPTLRKI